jgi:hypothetical protein
MRQLKHIGRISNTGAKVVVAFRTLPGDSGSALVVGVSTLSDSYHDALMTVLESDQGQDANEFGEIMHTRMFPDGRPMLQAMQQDGRLAKVSTATILMTPNTNASIPLNELNQLIAEQKNVAVDDLAGLVSGAPQNYKSEVKEVAKVTETKEPAPARAQAASNEVLSDTDLAKSFRSQADAMYKEAARLRKQADELDPPKKKATKATEEASA